ncbi:MAG: bacteriocin [Balneolaceae bacterium]|nr:bacteriocin [Balneolaceae bacterium]
MIQPELEGAAAKADWWDSWGRCAAGTLGGAGLGALSGAGVGGAGCTVVLPIVGTVACGTVGGVVGGVSGALAGAAAAC